ncbi:hypothetical protein OA848_00275 [Rickettsiales bacterium]|nr:hypothetical protein [Rickettsiales bacterium]
MKLFLFLIILSNLCFYSSTVNSSISDIRKYEKLNIYDEKTFSSGPMGIGLTKSYKIEEKLVCIYSTVTGQKEIEIKHKQISCPKELPK